jgi:hypothetical protein
MQGGEELTGNNLEVARNIYLDAMRDAIRHARLLADTGASKQIVNRIIEPYTHIKVIVTSTQWANWYALRDHPAAEPHIELLAKAMLESFEASTPTELPFGGWHLPYVDATDDEIDHAALYALEQNPRLGDNEDNLMAEILSILAKVSVARCARVSYDNHDGTKPRLLKDLLLYADLMEKRPLHASPAEHQASPDRLVGPSWESPHLHGNFVGWKQYRKLFPHENVPDKPYVKRKI